MLLHANTIGNRKRLLLREHRNTGIALPFGIIPVLMIALCF